MNKTGFWYRLVHLNPALFRGLIMATILMLAATGIKISADLPDILIGWVAAVLAIVQALWTSPAVTPNDKVVVYVPDPAKPAQIESGDATTKATDKEIIEAARGTSTDPYADGTF